MQEKAQASIIVDPADHVGGSVTRESLGPPKATVGSPVTPKKLFLNVKHTFFSHLSQRLSLMIVFCTKLTKIPKTDT